MSFKQFLVSIFLLVICVVCKLCLPHPGIDPIAGILLFVPRTFSRVLWYAIIVASVILYDVITVGFGIWTLSVVAVYMLIAIAYNKFRLPSQSWSTMMIRGIAMTVVFDVLTGLTVGPLLFGQPFAVALMGQIPFTLIHLVGNCLLISGYCMVIHYSGCVQKYVYEKNLNGLFVVNTNRR
jgi:hypothetical protein